MVMMYRLLFTALATVTLIGLSTDLRTAHAAQTKVLLCFPGGPGTTQDAQPIVDRFVARLAPLAGWGSAAGRYVNSRAACEREMRAGYQVLMAPLDVYLERRVQWGLKAASELKTTQTSGQFHVLAKAGVTMASLAGQKVITPLKITPNFLVKIAFPIQAATVRALQISSVRSAYRAIKNVARDKAAAAIINDIQKRSLKGLKMAQGLAVIHSGARLPGALVAGTGGKVPGNLAKALRTLCQQDKKICKDMRLTGFKPVNAALLIRLEKQLGR
jgi:hypothetical protein